MSFSQAKYEIQQLVAGNNLARAIQLLIRIAQENRLECKNDTLVLSREFFGLEDYIKRGLVKWEDEKAEKNLLAYRILELTDSIENSHPQVFFEKEKNFEEKSIKRA